MAGRNIKKSDGKVNTTIRCQKCGMNIPEETNRLPCPNCGEVGRNYIVTINEKLGITAEISRESEKIIFSKTLLGIYRAIFALCILVVLFGAFQTDPFYKNIITIAPVVFFYFITLLLFIYVVVKVNPIEKELGLYKFNWKSFDWIGHLRIPTIYLLSILIFCYYILNIVGLARLEIDFIILSSTFGSLVLAAGAFLDDKCKRKKLWGIAKSFIYAAFFLIIFNITYTILVTIGFNPKPQFNNLCTTQFLSWLAQGLLFFLCVIGGMFFGIYLLAKALVDLILFVKKY